MLTIKISNKMGQKKCENYGKIWQFLDTPKNYWYGLMGRNIKVSESKIGFLILKNRIDKHLINNLIKTYYIIKIYKKI